MKNQLTVEEKAEIGRAILKEFLRNKGIDFKSDLRREIGNLAKATGIDAVNITTYIHDILTELYLDWWSGPRDSGLLDRAIRQS